MMKKDCRVCKYSRKVTALGITDYYCRVSGESIFAFGLKALMCGLFSRK